MGIWGWSPQPQEVRGSEGRAPSDRRFSRFFNKDKTFLGLNFCFITILWREQAEDKLSNFAWIMTNFTINSKALFLPLRAWKNDIDNSLTIVFWSIFLTIAHQRKRTFSFFLWPFQLLMTPHYSMSLSRDPSDFWWKIRKSKTYQKGRMGVWWRSLQSPEARGSGGWAPRARRFSGFFIKNKTFLGLNFRFITILWREQVEKEVELFRLDHDKLTINSKALFLLPRAWRNEIDNA